MMARSIYDGTLTEAALADPNNTHSILLRLVGESRDVLEIGCATGYMTRVMAHSQDCRVTGFEINAEAATVAMPYLRRLIVGDLEDEVDLTQINDQFDVILVADVLEHLAWPDVPLRALGFCLRPNGRLIVSLPNVAHWKIRRALFAGGWDLTDQGLMDRTHLRWYTRHTATALIESAGYKVLLRRASYAFPAHWRLGIGPYIAAWAQARTMPAAFDDLFAIQHIFVAATLV